MQARELLFEKIEQLPPQKIAEVINFVDFLAERTESTKIEDTKTTAEVSSARELNKYLAAGWILILSYVRHQSDSQQPRFVVAWQNDEEAVYPELLDEWELHEIDRQMNR